MHHSKLIAVTVAIVIVSTFTFLALTQSDNSSSPDGTSQPPAASKESSGVVDTPALLIGDSDAPVRIVEYGDYKCPSCNQFHQTVEKEIHDNYIDTGDAAIEYRNLPYLAEDSRRAAQGSYCANDQGVFATYHSRVFDYMWNNYYVLGNTSAQSEDVLTLDTLTDIAKASGAKSIEFRNCVEASTFDSLVTRDLKASEADQAFGTPTFIVAGQKITGPQPYTVFKTLIDVELQ